MKPAPDVPGDTPAERMSNALNMVLKVSKDDLLKKEARLKRAKEKKRAKKNYLQVCGRLPSTCKYIQAGAIMGWDHGLS